MSLYIDIDEGELAARPMSIRARRPHRDRIHGTVPRPAAVWRWFPGPV